MTDRGISLTSCDLTQPSEKSSMHRSGGARAPSIPVHISENMLAELLCVRESSLLRFLRTSAIQSIIRSLSNTCIALHNRFLHI